MLAASHTTPQVAGAKELVDAGKRGLNALGLPTDADGAARAVLGELGVSEKKVSETVVKGILGFGLDQVGIPVEVLDHVGIKFEGKAKKDLATALFRHTLQLRYNLRVYLDTLQPRSRQAADIREVLDGDLPQTVEDIEKIAKDSEMGWWERVARETVRSTVSMGVEIGTAAATAGISVAGSAATAIATGKTPGGHAAHAVYLPANQKNNELTIESMQTLLAKVKGKLSRVFTAAGGENDRAAPLLDKVQLALDYSEKDLELLYTFAHSD